MSDGRVCLGVVVILLVRVIPIATVVPFITLTTTITIIHISSSSSSSSSSSMISVVITTTAGLAGGPGHDDPPGGSHPWAHRLRAHTRAHQPPARAPGRVQVLLDPRPGGLHTVGQDTGSNLNMRTVPRRRFYDLFQRHHDVLGRLEASPTTHRGASSLLCGV
jgi:hypothetical protein